MGKYRRYRRVKKKRRSIKELMTVLGILVAIAYLLTALHVSIPVAGNFLVYSVSGTKTINVTLFRVKYIAPPETGNKTVEVYVDGKSVTFQIPEGKEGYTIYLNKSKLIEVNQERVQTQITVPSAVSNLTYPGPPLNTTYIGRSEDYIVSHYPYELHFIFTIQLCNVTADVRPSGVAVDELKLEYISGEDRPKEEVLLRCNDDGCRGSPHSRCILSYNVTSKLTYLGIFKLDYMNGKASLRFLDNPWIPIALYIVTIISLYISLKKFYRMRQP